MINFLKAEEQHQHKNGGGWVANTAKVEETAYIGPDALVFGDAKVYGDARVYGDAQVYGNAQVSGDAQVYGDAWENSPLYIQGSRHSLTLASYTEIAIGCHLHTITFWEYNYQSIGEAEGYSEHEVEEYLGYIRLCEQYVVRHCKGKE